MRRHLKEDAEDVKSITSVNLILKKLGTGEDEVKFLQAPTDRSGSEFFFEPDLRYCAQDSTQNSDERRKPQPDDRDEWGHMYEEFFWRRLVQVINDDWRRR